MKNSLPARLHTVMIPFVQHPSHDHIMKTENGSVVASSEGGGEGEWRPRLQKGSKRDPCDGTVLYLDGGGGHTNVHM